MAEGQGSDQNSGPVPDEPTPADEGLADSELAQALEDAVGGTAPSESDLASLQAAVHADLKAETGAVAWLRSLSTPVRILIGVAAVLVVPLAAVLIAPRPAVDLHPAFFAGVALSAVVLICVLAPTSLRGYQRPGTVRGFFAVVIALALAWPIVIGFLPYLSAPGWMPGDTIFHGINCFSTGLVLAAIPLAMLRLLDRGEHGSLSRVGLAAAGAGLAGVLSLELMCPVITRAHVLGAHATVLFVVFGGYLLLRRYRREVPAR